MPLPHVFIAEVNVTLWTTGLEPVEEWPNRPIIHVAGTSNPPGSGPNKATVAGTVRMTPDGHVRWSLATSVEAEEVWVTEGVQLGNIGSAFGVMGLWMHAHRLPVGCFWLWKTS